MAVSRLKLDVRWLVFAVVATVAVFSFIVSYSHIYDLGRLHAQAGTAARLLPLSVDLLIVAASLVLFTLERPARRRSPGFWMPRLVLYTAIGATVAANVAYGLPDGWLSAVISGWPGAAFVAAVEVGILVADPVKRGRAGSGTGAARPSSAGTVPSSNVKAAEARLRQALDLGFDYSDNKMRADFHLTRAAATAVRNRVTERSRGAQPNPAHAPAAQTAPAGPAPVPAGVNGSGPHA